MARKTSMFDHDHGSVVLVMEGDGCPVGEIRPRVETRYDRSTNRRYVGSVRSLDRWDALWLDVWDGWGCWLYEGYPGRLLNGHPTTRTRMAG